jgi:hypothetical protein
MLCAPVVDGDREELSDVELRRLVPVRRVAGERSRNRRFAFDLVEHGAAPAAPSGLVGRSVAVVAADRFAVIVAVAIAVAIAVASVAVRAVLVAVAAERVRDRFAVVVPEVA